jgi:hypothetical protein
MHSAGLISAAGFFSQFMMGLTFTWLSFSDEAWFHLHGYISSQNNQNWNSLNHHLIDEIPHHDVKVGVWCAMNEC